MTTILFVDDEKRWVTPYLDALKDDGFEVYYEPTVDGALQFFEANRDDIALLILDTMMPHGKSFSPNETQRGLRTGVHFYKRIREETPGLNIPVIFLTNVSDDEVKQIVDQQINCQLIRKSECFPYELVEKIRSILL